MYGCMVHVLQGHIQQLTETHSSTSTCLHNHFQALVLVKTFFLLQALINWKNMQDFQPPVGTLTYNAVRFKYHYQPEYQSNKSAFNNTLAVASQRCPSMY